MAVMIVVSEIELHLGRGLRYKFGSEPVQRRWTSFGEQRREVKSSELQRGP